MIAMNSKPQNFLVFRWEDVAAAIRQALQLNGQTSAQIAVADVAATPSTTCVASDAVGTFPVVTA